jgi:hypothetical protein
VESKLRSVYEIRTLLIVGHWIFSHGSLSNVQAAGQKMMALLFVGLLALVCMVSTIIIMKGRGCLQADIAAILGLEVAVFAIPLGPLLNALLTD